MDIPAELKNAAEEIAGEISRPVLAEAVRRNTEKYKSESGTGKRLVTSHADAAAYCVTRMPATYGAVSAALEYSLAGSDESFSTVLDAGAGTGTAAWAAEELLGGIDVICVEREGAMSDIGKRLMEGRDLQKRVTWVSSELENYRTEQKFDLVIASYVTNEMTAQMRMQTASHLWKMTGKMLVIVEPGTPEGFSCICEIKKSLADSGAHIAAPCPNDGQCPLPQNDWCHFTRRVARSRLHKQLKGGDAPYEDEKFSYAAFSRSACETCGARVLRHPVTESGKIKLKLCTKSGLQEKTVSKGDKAGFKAARKVSCGDIFDGAK